MNPLDKLMAWAQIGLSVMLFGGTATLVYYEMSHLGQMSVDQIKTFDSSIEWLRTGCGIVIFFWFQRQRAAGIPDAPQVITQTRTEPNGTTTTIVKPVNKGPIPDATSQTIPPVPPPSNTG